MNILKVLLIFGLIIIFIINFFLLSYGLIFIYSILFIKYLLQISQQYFFIASFTIMLMLFAIPFLNSIFLINLIFESRKPLEIENDKLYNILNNVFKYYPNLSKKLKILINDRYLFELECISNNYIIINRHLIYQLNEEELTAIIFHQCELINNNIGELNFLILTITFPDIIFKFLYNQFISLTNLVNKFVGTLSNTVIYLIRMIVLILFLPIIIINFILFNFKKYVLLYLYNLIIFKADKNIKESIIIVGLINYLHKNISINPNNKFLIKRIQNLSSSLSKNI